MKIKGNYGNSYNHLKRWHLSCRVFVKKNKDNWYQKNRNDILKERKDNRPKYLEKEQNYRHTHKDKISECNNRPCKDPIRHDVCTRCALKHRISRNKELYGDTKLTDCLIKDLMIIP